jgi:uncharacterized protein YdeI (YjbR/CyaY-like superfamily)
MNPKVTEYIETAEKWQAEFEILRKIVLDCDLIEDFKWGCPCYTFQKSNVVIIHGFKEYCAILFVKGALLQDEDKILIQQTENVQSGRQIRFKTAKEIIALESTIKAYIFEAVEVEKAGLQVERKKTEDYSIPEEFQKVLDKNHDVKKAFEALTPGRQRAYLFYFAEPKQSKTRDSRIEVNLQRILNGKGLNDCICGLSKRKPNCDGSHKYIS